jgi:parallel beta-helix repeat protein
MKYILLPLLIALCTMVQAKTYYFSVTSGSDSYSEEQAQSQATPWKSVSKLNSIMSLLQPGDKVLFKRGDKFFGTIKVGTSGFNGMPVTFGSYGSGDTKPILDCRIQLESWTSLGGNVWESSGVYIQPTALMINEVLKPLGRYPNLDDPNRGYLTITSHPAGSKTVFSDNTLSSSLNWTGAEVVMRTSHWTLDRRTIVSQSGQTIYLATDTQYEIKDQYGYFFQNHPATLDKEGEWCYIKSENKILLYLSQNPQTSVIKIATSDFGIEIESQSYLVIDGLMINGAKNSAINLSNAGFCTIKNCDFINSGTNALNIGRNFLFESSDSITVIGNTFKNTQSNCINASGTLISFKNNTIKNTGMVPGMAESGQRGFGIYAAVKGLLCERNNIDSTGYVPIMFLWSSDVLIKENYVSNYTTVLDDGGGIYCWSRYSDPTDPNVPVNRKIINNVVINAIGAPEGTSIKTSQASGIYLDDNSHNVEVKGNTIAYCGDVGVVLHNVRNCQVINNIVFSCGRAGLRTNFDAAQTNPQRNLNIQNNQLIADSYSQSVMNHETLDELIKPGNINNNYFCHPFKKDNYINYIYKQSSTLKNFSFGLSDWQNFSGFDLNTKITPHYYPTYTPIDKPVNGIPNGTFESNTSNWNKWNPAGNSSEVSWVTGQLDGGCLSFSVVGSGGTNSSRLETKIPAIESGRTYLLKLSARSSVDGAINCYLIQNSVPYTFGSTGNYSMKTGFDRREIEILIKATASIPVPSLFIMAGPEDGTVFIDNVEFYEVTPIDNYDELMVLEYNATTTARQWVADKNYITPLGISYAKGSVINIPVFGSVVLLSLDTGIGSGELFSSDPGIVSGVTRYGQNKNTNVQIFPNPLINNDLTVSLKGFTSKENNWIFVYDINGKLIYKLFVRSENDEKITIRRDIFSNGMYLIKVVRNSEIVGVNKLIVQ